MKEEPQIIHYYNELPDYAIIINNLNEEYEDLIMNYIQLADRIDPKINKNTYTCCYFTLVFITVFEFSMIMIYW